MNDTTINLNENLTIRLASYAGQKGEKSFVDAIQRLLDESDASKDLPVGQLHSSNHNAQILLGRLEIICFVPASDEPVDRDILKHEILKSTKRLVKVTRTYHNGQTEEKIWNASNIIDSSNINSNINSHTSCLRDWRKKGIIKIVLHLLDD